MVRIHLLGSPYVEVDGRRVIFPLKKAEALLYYVAMEGRVDREYVTSLLWGEKDERSAHNNLRNALYVLRKMIPSDTLSIDRKSVEFGEVETDLSDVDRLSDPDVPISPRIYEEFLKGFTIPESPLFEEWITLSREVVRKRILDALYDRVKSCYDREDTEELRTSLETLLIIDPFDEDMVLELAELYMKGNQAVRAFELFSDFKNKLKKQLGLVPSERGEAAFSRLLLKKGQEEKRQDEEDATKYFSGRDDELTRIFAFLTEADDRSVAIFVNGEPGVGKTSLVRRVLDSLSDEDILILYATGYETEQSFPYSPWISFAAQLGELASASELALAPRKLAAIAGVSPGFLKNRKFNTTSDMLLMSQNDPVLLGSALADLAEEVLGWKRLVIVMEDLHWFDIQSLRLLPIFMAQISVPVILFATCRPEAASEADMIFKRLQHDNVLNYLPIALLPFTPAETDALCSRFLDRDVIEAKGEDFFHRESEGLPLLLVELIRSLADNLEIDWKKGIGASILARMGRMTELQKGFLQVLSIFPQPVQLPLLGRVMNETSLNLADIAEDLLHKGMIEEKTERGQEGSIAFRHEKVRECIYESLPVFRRIELHRRIGEILGETYQPQIWNPSLSAALCHHYEQAGMQDKALDLHLQELIFHITLNHELFPMVQDWVFRSCLMPYSDRNDTEQRMDKIRDLLHILNRKNEGNREILRMEGAYLELRGGYHIAWGQYKEGRLFINRAIQIADGHGFDNIKIHCLQHLSHYHLQTDNWEKLLFHARRMFHLAKKMERDNYAGVALRFIGVAYQLAGKYDLAEKAFGQSIALFEDLKKVGKNYPLCILSAFSYIGEMYYWRGDMSTALEYFGRCIKGCEEEDFFWGCSHFHAHAADVAFDLGDFDSMYGHIDQGVEIFEKSQGGRCGSTLYSLKAITDVRRGHFDDARRSLEIGDALCSPIRKKSWSAVQLLSKAYVSDQAKRMKALACFEGLLDRVAEDYALEALELYRAIPVPHRVAQLETFLQEGRFHTSKIF